MKAENATATVLVTGANKGIGHEVARRLVEAGHSVWVGARDAERGREAAAKLGQNARFVQLDVTDDASIREAAQTVGKAGGLDVLVNNAGIVQPDAPNDPRGPLRAVFDVNVFGAIAVTYAFLPLLRKSGAPRIVNVSSDLGSLTRATDPDYEFYNLELVAYPASKAALNMATVQLAKHLAGTPFKVNAANPGYTATDLNSHRGYQTVEQAAEVIVRLATLGPDGPTGGFFFNEGEVPW
ncbi:MAG: SDR family oxidoreductase [Proteobacteria bacterium]|nr:SDR family oxidoreductase [Pseudomonadota bacterium]